MKNIELTLTGWVPDDFDTDYLTTSGADQDFENLALYVMNSCGRKVKLENHSTMSARELEPTYKPGQVWEDALGCVYRYDETWGVGAWLIFGDDVRFARNLPKRPLKLLKDVT